MLVKILDMVDKLVVVIIDMVVILVMMVDMVDMVDMVIVIMKLSAYAAGHERGRGWCPAVWRAETEDRNSKSLDQVSDDNYYDEDHEHRDERERIKK